MLNSQYAPHMLQNILVKLFTLNMADSTLVSYLTVLWDSSFETH
jgi:hypothetical protein